MHLSITIMMHESHTFCSTYVWKPMSSSQDHLVQHLQTLKDTKYNILFIFHTSLQSFPLRRCITRVHESQASDHLGNPPFTLHNSFYYPSPYRCVPFFTFAFFYTSHPDVVPTPRIPVLVCRVERNPSTFFLVLVLSFFLVHT